MVAKIPLHSSSVSNGCLGDVFLSPLFVRGFHKAAIVMHVDPTINNTAPIPNTIFIRIDI